MMICVVYMSASFAQEQPNRSSRAQAYYDRFEYANAIPLFIEIASKEKESNLKTIEQLAYSYSQINDFVQSEKWYAKAVQHTDHTPEHVFQYGKALKNIGKYSEAKAQFQKYGALNNPVADFKNEISGCDSALVWQKDVSQFKVENLRDINTEMADFSPYILNDNFYFVSDRHSEESSKKYGWTGRPFLKVFSTGINSTYQVANSPLLTPNFNDFGTHIGPIASPDNGETVFVSITNPGKVSTTEKVNRVKYKTQRLGIYMYTKNGNAYNEPVPFAYNDFENYSVGHPTFSKDGNTLYFASDMPGGMGGSDIWFSLKQSDGSWGTPVNAGPSINTSFDELFPTINPDGKLYFSSAGLPGLGGLDIFKAEGEKNNWASVLNLGLNINSSADDFSYLIVKDTEENMMGFLSSNRFGGKGDDDIYSFSYDKPAKPIFVAVRGVVYHKQTQHPLLANVQIAELGGSNPRTIETKEDGKFFFDLDLNKDYEILGEKLRFDKDLAALNTHNIQVSDTLEVSLYLEPTMVVGRTFVLENLYYDFDKHNIRSDAALILDDLLKILNEYPSMKIELSSHTDSRGSDSYNEALSQRRAQSAVEYLIKNGISRSRLVAKGYGEYKLVNECSNGVACSEEAHQLNRRTEFTILELNENI